MRTASVTDLHSHGFSSNYCPVTRQVMPNMTRDFGNYHISYCRYQSHYGSDTTALVLQSRVFFILSGYHAHDLVEAAQEAGIHGCIAVFIDRIGQANPLSEHRMAVGFASDPFNLSETTRDIIGQGGIDRIRSACETQASGDEWDRE